MFPSFKYRPEIDDVKRGILRHLFALFITLLFVKIIVTHQLCVYFHLSKKIAFLCYTKYASRTCCSC